MPRSVPAPRLLKLDVMRVIAMVVGLVALVAVHRTADACGAVYCVPGAFTPSDGATVPANLPALHWQPMDQTRDSKADPALVTIATTAAPDVPLGFTPVPQSNGDYLLVLAEPLVPGTSYVASDHNTCSGQSAPRAVFHAGPAAPLPTSLGSLSRTAGTVATLALRPPGGTCQMPFEADQVTIGLEVSADAAPWRDALLLQTDVDGQPWSRPNNLSQREAAETTWRGAGVDLVYRGCVPDTGGLSAGVHTVVMTGVIPGAGTSLSSADMIALACPRDPLTCSDTEPSCERGGCAAGGSPALSGLLVVVGAWLARKRRRRVSRASRGS